MFRNFINKSFKSETGIAHLALIVLGIIGIAVTLYLVGTRTNFLPSAQQDLMPLETSFRLQLEPRYRIWDLATNESAGEGTAIPNHMIGDDMGIKPGETFRVNVLVASDIDYSNAFSAYISYPKDLIEVQSIIKEEGIGDIAGYKHPKMDSILVQLIKTKERGDANVEELAKGWGLELKNGKVKVTLRTYPKFNPATANLSQYGFEQIASYETLIDGYAVIDSLYKLAEVEYVEYISAAYRPHTFDRGAMTTANAGAFVDEQAPSTRSAEDRVCAQVLTRACNLQQVQCVTEPCYPQEVCQTFSTPCDVPEGWYLERNKCNSDADCRGDNQFCDYLNHPPRNPEIKICRERTYSCWERCTDDALKDAGTSTGSCNESLYGYNQITQGDTVRQIRGCAVNETGDVYTCERGVLGKDNFGKTPFCQPQPSCKPIPSCVYSNSGCDIYIDPNDPTWCRETPLPTCMPVPSCVYSNPACDIQINWDDPKWCREVPSVGNYFIQFWLPDTNFDNVNGRLVLSGGVANPGIKTVSWQKPIMATIVFKALKAGEARIDLTDESLILRNSDSANIISKKEGLTVTVSDNPVIKGDLDGDGVVGFKDFSILLSRWGSNDKKADLNGDGKVNIYDFSAMLSNWVGKKGRIKKCPEQWIQNRMPTVVDESGNNASSPAEYYIYEGKRRELHEFDRDWVKSNCNITPETVY